LTGGCPKRPDRLKNLSGRKRNKLIQGGLIGFAKFRTFQTTSLRGRSEIKNRQKIENEDNS